MLGDPLEFGIIMMSIALYRAAEAGAWRGGLVAGGIRSRLAGSAMCKLKVFRADRAHVHDHVAFRFELAKDCPDGKPAWSLRPVCVGRQRPVADVSHPICLRA